MYFYEGNTPDLFWKTKNNLYGFQVGVEAILCQTSQWEIDGFVKVGIFANDASVSSQTVVPDFPTFTNNGNNDSHTSHFAELGINGSYRINSCWSLKAGYRVMWLGGVLEAANQVPATTNQAVTLTHASSNVFYHGATAYLQARW